MPIKNRFADMQDEITGWRRHLHENPELLFDTPKTSAFITEKLKEFGCDEVVGKIGRTGVVAVIKGKTNTSGKVVGLRADFDALPIMEATGLDYASKTPGIMHACGHDGHTAMLLGAAKYLAETRNFDGTAVMIFQPAEEGGGGGKEMVDDGMMERWDIQEVYGMHNWPGKDIGEFALRPGPFFAATDTFEIVVEGKGGHAAKPDVCIDPTVVGSHIVLAFQSIVSRSVDPVKQAVVSVTSFETESKAFNVIPQVVTLRGTVRTLDTEVRALVEARLIKLAEATADAYDAVANVNYIKGYPATVNHATETEYAAASAAKVSGACDVDAALVMGGEDFSYMLESRPGAYILMGNGAEGAMVHHPEYNFNDEAIPSGCSWWAEMVESRMPAS